MIDLMETLEYVQAYIDDLLCITRGSLEDHLDKLEEVLKRLHDVGLKVNAAKSFLCTHEIKYLGYMLTRGGIKPRIKKVQAILAIKPPNNVKQLRHFLGMVQYYRDMWTKRSEMLAPLSDLVGECGETKTTRKNKVKNNLGSGIQLTKKHLTTSKRPSLKRWFWPIQTSQCPLTYTPMHPPSSWERL
jgi:hypothetical protein